MVAAGPLPALVMALTLKEYEEKGFNPSTWRVLVPAPCTGISPGESGPTTFTVYPVMLPFSFSTGTGDQESSAVVGSLCLTVNPPGHPEGAGSKCESVYMCTSNNIMMQRPSMSYSIHLIFYHGCMFYSIGLLHMRITYHTLCLSTRLISICCHSNCIVLHTIVLCSVRSIARSKVNTKWEDAK